MTKLIATLIAAAFASTAVLAADPAKKPEMKADAPAAAAAPAAKADKAAKATKAAKADAKAAPAAAAASK